MHESILIGLTAILVLGIGAQWLAWRFHMPAILLLLLFGIAAGPVWAWATGKPALIAPDALLGDLLFPVVSFSVAIILFEGGLSLRMRELKKIGRTVVLLIVIGVPVTWLLATLAAHHIAGLSKPIAVLFGAILVVTGPTVIAPMLRHIRPRGAVGPIVKWEGILNDPVGAILAVLVYEALLATNFDQVTAQSAMGLFHTVVTSSALGLVGAALLVIMIKRHWLPDFLHNAFTLMCVIGAFALSNHIQEESGLFAVTIMGIALANQRYVNVDHIAEFKENLQILLISGLFVLLAARLRLEDLQQFDARAFAFLAVLIIIVRPVAIVLSTVGRKLSWREKVFLMWMAPRGIVAAAVASIFALRLADASIAAQHPTITDAHRLVPLMFLVIIGTITVYGIGAPIVARRLRLAEAHPQGLVMLGAHEWARKIAAMLKDQGFAVLLIDTNRANVRDARMAGLDAMTGDILRESTRERILDSGARRLLAMTPNDEANALAVDQLVDDYGSAGVYQLAPHVRNASKGDGEVGGTGDAVVRGRILFAKRATFAYFRDAFANGAEMKATNITEEFDFEDFQKQHGEAALPMFLVSDNGRLTVCNTDQSLEPAAGQKLISLTMPWKEAQIKK